MRGKGKTVVMTGATGGIGGVVCRYLVNEGYKVFAGYRNIAATKPFPGSNIEFIPLDLTSFASVDAFSDEIIRRTESMPIDIIINNAGIIARKRGATADGYETSLQVNYMSAKRLTERLLPHLQKEGGKIINTLSCTIRQGEYTEPVPLASTADENTIESLKDYSNSKFMLALYTAELHKRVGKNIFVYGVDPGVVNTGIITMHRWYDPLANIFFRPFIKSPEQGAVPMINAINSSVRGEELPLLFKGNKIRHLPKKISNFT